jgi:DNA-binding XRE family transcriptional regulator
LAGSRLRESRRFNGSTNITQGKAYVVNDGMLRLRAPLPLFGIAKYRRFWSIRHTIRPISLFVWERWSDGRSFAEAEWAFNWPHLRQLLKARNIRPRGDEKFTFEFLNARQRLELSQEQLANALNVTARTLQDWEAGRGTSQMYKKTRDLRELLSRMDDYVVAPKEKEWFSSPL